MKTPLPKRPSPPPGSTPRPTATPTCHLSRLRSRAPRPAPGPLPSAAVRKGREMREKPAPPSARPCPIAVGRARAAASPSVTSRNLATPQPSLRSRRRARSQHKMAAVGSAAGEERAEPSYVLSPGRAGPPSAAPADRRGAPRGPGRGRLPASGRFRPEKENRRVAGRSVPVPPYKRPPPLRLLPSALWPPQAPPRGSRAPAPTSINCAL